MSFFNKAREEELIGNFLKDLEFANKIVQGQLTYTDLADPKCQTIFKTAFEFYLARQQLPDILILADLLGKTQEEKIYYEAELRKITSRNYSIETLDYRIDELKELSITRRVIEIINNTKIKLQSGVNGRNLVNFILEQINSLGLSYRKIETTKLIDGMSKLVEKLETGEKDIFLQSGFKAFDEKIIGFPQGLTYLIGRPGMGKTMLLENFLRIHSIENKVPVLFISAEMKIEEHMERILSMCSGIDYSKIVSRKNLTDEDYKSITDVVPIFESSPSYFLFSPDLNVPTIRAMIGLYKKFYGIRAVYVDYMQLLSGAESKLQKERSDFEEVTEGLRQASQFYSVPIIAAAQANRAVEMRKNKRLILSDIRETDKAAMDSHLVGAIYNDEYYNSETDSKGVLEVGILKARKAKAGQTIFLRALWDIQRIEDFDRNFVF